MTSLAGIGLLSATIYAFWNFLPRAGVPHRLVTTAWAPYIGVAFTAAFTLAIAMILGGLVELFT